MSTGHQSGGVGGSRLASRVERLLTTSPIFIYVTHLGETDTFPGWTRLLIGPGREFGGGLLWATLHSPDNAPPGKHVLQAMRLSPHRDIADATRVRSVHDAFRDMLGTLSAVEEMVVRVVEP